MFLRNAGSYKGKLHSGRATHASSILVWLSAVKRVKIGKDNDCIKRILDAEPEI